MPVDSALCACGSGLRHARCCGLDMANLSPAGASDPLLPLVNQAIEAEKKGARDVAAHFALEVLELAPGQPDALRVLYQVRKEENCQSAASALLNRIVALDPNTLWATHELALMLMQQGDLASAEVHARNAVRIAPRHPQSHNLMGMILTEANRPQIGEYHYRRVFALSGSSDPVLLANLAWNLKTQGRMAEARSLYEQSLAVGAPAIQTLLGRARLEEADRDFTAAAATLDRLDEIAPEHPSALLARAVLSGRTGAYDQALALLERIAAREGALGPAELIEKGQLFDRLGRIDDAFAAFSEAKERLRALSGKQYLAQHAENLAARCKGFFTASRLGTLPRAGIRKDAPQPIFILGFPRSGTTLVEQMLSAHPAINAADELPLINDLTGIMPRMLNSPLGYPEALAELWMGDQLQGLDNLRDYYLQRAQQMGVPAGRQWFTDKMPLNETHLGLIALIFPAAPLIHVLRHPLDVVLSAFSNLLTHGFYCAYALESIARHYVLISNLVEHYRREMTIRYLPLHYEELVHDQEASVRRLLDFAGIPFDRACLDFHENRRYARTASYAQVTEKLYTRSCNRWRKYRRHLGPVLPILEPVITRLGYTID